MKGRRTQQIVGLIESKGPRPTPASEFRGGADSLYLGSEGANYFAQHFYDRLAFGRKYQARYFAPFCSAQSVLLDFGCGDGTILRQLHAARKIGIELNELCRGRILQANEHETIPIEVVQDISAVPDRSVDVAISNHCLEHVELPLDCLRRIRRTLIDDGRLVLVTPFDDWRSQVHRSWSPQDADHHLYTWTPRNLGNLVAAAGFQVAESNIMSFAWTSKLFWLHHFLGDRCFKLACRLFSIYKIRREVFCVGINRARS